MLVHPVKVPIRGKVFVEFNKIIVYYYIVQSYLFILSLFFVNIFYCQNINSGFESEVDSTNNIYEINIQFGDTTKIDTSSIITIYYNDGSTSVHSQLVMDMKWVWNGMKGFKAETILTADGTTVIKATDIHKIIGRDGKITMGEKLRTVAFVSTTIPYVLAGIILSLALII